jgi:uncharacterized protein (TIGR03437 family)
MNLKMSLLAFGVIGLVSSLMPRETALLRLGLTREVSANAFIPGPAIEGTIFAVTAGNNLISFNQANPSAIIKSSAITGLQSGESIAGLDIRPRTGQLFAMSAQSRLYTIDPATGAATPVGSAQFAPALNGTSFGFDFNPVPDRIRVTSDADQNLRLNPDTGAVAATDGTLVFAAGDPNVNANPNLVAVAYTNSFAGASATTLYGIDSNLDALVLQGSQGGSPVSPNTGQLTTVGPLGVNASDQTGFDIVGTTGAAFASLTAQGAATSSLYTVNLATGAAALVGPIGVNEVIRDIAAVVRVETVYALTTGNNLLAFSSGAPGAIVSTRPIIGLAQGELLVGIDFRPATGQLYAMSNASRVYIVNTANGAATAAGGAPFAPALAGNNFGFDFNPAPDRIRAVSDAGQNLRLNPNNGAVAGTDGNLAFASGDANANATPNVVGSAYTNNFAGTTTTTLYGIDSRLDSLVLQGSIGGSPVSPNTGQLTTAGPLGVDTNENVGFDIAPVTGAAFASLTIAGSASSNLFTINLSTGAAAMVGPIGGGETIRDIAIAPRVETVYAVTLSNKLISFVSTAPGVIQNTAAINGLLGDESIIGLDFRPATGQLYAIGSSSRIYTINPVTGAATQVGTGITTPQLNGTAYGFDFNPVPDRIRVVSTATHNLRFHPDTGASAGIDAPLAYAQTDANAGRQTNIVGAAYNNSFAGTTSTTLYAIDSSLDILVRQGSPGGTPVSPNSGQLFTAGPLGVDTGEMVGFDISDCTNTGYASLTVGGASQLYTINLITGAATLIGNVGGGEVIRGIAVANAPSPASQSAGMTVANAASYAVDAIAPDSLAAIFGRFQTTGGNTYIAPSMPLPTTLGGIRVTVNGQDARLWAAGNAQINIVAPQNIPDGPASVVITNSDGTIRAGTVSMVRAATGIFTARSNGLGTAAGLWTTDGVNFQPVFNPDGSERPVGAGTRDRPAFLVLFTTGLRHAPAANPNDANGVAEAVTITAGSVNATAAFAGPAPGFIGLDQVNVVIPPELAGAGVVQIRLTAAGKASNPVTVRIN